MFIYRDEVMKRVKEHHDSLVPAYEVMVTALQGSQNYGLDEYSEEYMSDVDTKSIVLPHFKDFVCNSKPVSKVVEMENGEHAEVKDIRIMMEMFRKENVSYLELLYSKYVVVNPKYKDLWEMLVNNRDKIFKAHPTRLANAIAGMGLEKRKALCHPYPTIKYKIDKWGFDGKQLSHCVRLYEFFCRMLAGTPHYESSCREGLMNFKKQLDWNGKRELTPQEAIKICDFYCAEMDKLKDWVKENSTDEGDAAVLDTVTYEALSRMFKEEILEGRKNG